MPDQTEKLMQLIPASETCICDRCEREIPPSHVVKKILPLPESGASPVQRVRAYCESCGTIYQLDRQLRSGLWDNLGGVTEVKDEQLRHNFIARIEHIQGVTQLQKAS